MVIIVSSSEDAHLPFAVKHLSSPPVIIDVANIIHKDGLSYAITATENKVLYRGKELHSVTGVWVRRPRIIPQHITLPVRQQDQAYCASAIRAHLDQLYVQFPEAVWVSDRYSLERAKNKTLQLRVAASLGLTIPDTILTSSPEDAERFRDEHDSVVVKPLANEFPHNSGVVYPFFTHKIGAGESVNYKGLHLAPAFFQAAVDHVSDIRVTVVGGQVFAARIVEKTPQKHGNIRDFRAHFGTKGALEYTAFKPPSHVAKSCIALVEKLGLRFGAIDFVEDADGRLIFLEVNVNGQWAFIEQETGQQIGKAVAALLEG